jgi:hypothetical protein
MCVTLYFFAQIQEASATGLAVSSDTPLALVPLCVP